MQLLYLLLYGSVWSWSSMVWLTNMKSLIPKGAKSTFVTSEKTSFFCASLYTCLRKTQYWIYNVFFLLVIFGSEMRSKGKLNNVVILINRLWSKMDLAPFEIKLFIYQSILNASVQMLLANKKQNKIWLNIYFFWIEWFWVLKRSQYSSDVRSDQQKKFHGNLECLQMCHTTFNRRSHEPTNRSLLRALCILTILTDSSVCVTADEYIHVSHVKFSYTNTWPTHCHSGGSRRGARPL